jgi:hypothetical protein
MRKLLNKLLEALGMRLLSVALEALPKDCSVRTGALRGLAEQRAYDRYEGYAELLKEQPVPFEKWREQWAWIQAKARSRVAS